MTVLPFISFFAAVVCIVGFGIRAGIKTKRDPVDFYLGGRTQGAWRSAIASFASAESGFVFLGLVGMAYTQGFVVLWILVGVVYGYLGTWLYMAPRLRSISEEYNTVTITQVIGLSAGKFKKPVVAYGAIVLTFAMIMYVAVQFHAIGKTMQAVSGWPIYIGVFVGAIIIVLYSAIGGLRSVSHTDVIQGVMMICSLVFLSIVAGIEVADGGSLVLQMEEISPKLISPFGGAEGWHAASYAFFYSIVGLGLTGAPHYLRKFMATRPKISYQNAAWIAMPSCFLLFCAAIFIGFAGRILLVNVDDPETIVIVLGNKTLFGATGIFYGLLVASLFGAIASTGDSQLLEATASLTEDTRTIGIHRFLNLSPRFIIVVVGVLAFVFATLGTETIFKRTLTAWAILGATFGPQLILVLSRTHLSGQGILSGMVVGSVTVLLWEFATPWSHTIYSLVPGFILSCFVTICVSRLSPSTTVRIKRLESLEDSHHKIK